MKKICNTCGKKKPILSFHRDSKGKDGFSASCGECRNFARRNKKLIEKVNGKIEKAKGTDVPKSVPYLLPKGFVEEMEKESESLDYAIEIGKKVLEIPAFQRIKVPVEITWEETGYEKVSKKFNDAHCHLSWKGKNAVLQVHNNPDVIFRGTPEEVIEKALAY